MSGGPGPVERTPLDDVFDPERASDAPPTLGPGAAVGDRIVLGPIVWGITDPSDGRVTLRYYANSKPTPVSRMRPTLIFEFRTVPWAQTGVQPVAWDLIPTAGERTYPILRIVAARSVRIRRHVTPMMSGPSRLLVNAENPLVEIYRVQDDSLVPGPDAVVEPRRIVRAPYEWLPGPDPEPRVPEIPTFSLEGMDEEQRRKLRTTSRLAADVHHLPTGIFARGAPRNWELSIEAPEYEPAAFAYELVGHEIPFMYHLRLVRTRNVDVKLAFEHGGRGEVPVFVEDAVVPRNRVPPQGAPLDPDRFSFGPLARSHMEPRLTARAHGQTLLLDAVIGSIPIIGTVYDAAHLAFAAATGRTFWGQPINDGDIVVMGVAVLIPIGLSSGSTRNLAQTLGRRRPAMRALTEESTHVAVERKADPALVDAIREIGAREREAVVDALKGYARGTNGARAVVRTFDDAVGSAYLQKVGRDPALERLRRVFSADFDGIHHPELLSAYRRYLARDGTADAVTWAKRTRGRSRALFVNELGPDFVRSLNRLSRDGQIPQVGAGSRIRAPTRERELLRVFEAHGNRPRSYDDLRAAIRQSNRRYGRQFGHHLEADHLLEKRFLSSVQVDSSLDQGNMMAMLIPKNPAVARELRRHGYTYEYVHSEKTAILNRLIPHGLEDRFTLQQWWDAHVFAFESLGVESRIFFRPLADTFRDVAGLRARQITFQTGLTERTFWPERWLSP